MDWTLSPLNTLPSRLRWGLVAMLTTLTALASAIVQRMLEAPFARPDSGFYLLMARGRMAEVPQPFASRPLAPLLVRGFAAVTHLSLAAGFVLLGWSSLLCTLAVVFLLATRTAAPRWVLVAIAAVPFWPQLLDGLALPDLPYAALLSCLLLCLAAKRYSAAALMMFPLMLARESTSLTLVCLLLVGWRQLRWSGCLLAVAGMAAGSLLVARLSAASGGNPEHLPGFVYMVAKVPWNLLRTLGVVPWSNLYPFLCAPPKRQYALRLGPLHSLGVCGFSANSPILAGIALLTTFGMLPVILLPLWLRRREIGAGDVLQRFCLLYGAASFVLAPMIGTWYSRLCGYGWPLFLVALPALFAGVPVVGGSPGRPGAPRQTRSRAGVAALATVGALLLLHAALGWFALQLPWPRLLDGAVLLQGAAVALFWVRFGNPSQSRENG